MRLRCITSIPSAITRVLVAGAIALAIAIAPALAQSPATTSQAAATAPTSAAPSVAATGAPQPAAAASPAAATAAVLDAHSVIVYLTDVINWYGHLGAEAQLVRDPDETLFFANDRQTAAEVLRLAFESARAQTAFLAKANPGAGAVAGPGSSASRSYEQGNIAQSAATLDAANNALRTRIKDSQARLAKAPARQRAAITSEIQDAQNELDLNQARIDALNALAQFESSSSSPDQTSTLAAQIDELEHSIPDTSKKPIALTADNAPAVRPEPTGILSLVSQLFALSNKLDALEQNIALAQGLSARAAAVRKSTISLITALDTRGKTLAQNSGGGADVAALKNRKTSFEGLLDEHKMLSAIALPLSKQIVLLGIYTNNVGRWHDAIAQRWNKEFRSLLIRLVVLATSLLVIFLGSLLWRWITDRYVTDIRRRGQVMAARRLVLGLLIVIVLMVNFSDELGSAATVVGFAAAGIAVALQNVILSIAGYFFLIGRFGIKAGDRVQIGGVMGDVIDIGLVKLSLMELGGTGTHREPTGRVAVFSNAIVFQPSGNFFKQAPGTSFVWNEVRLTLAPDIDYRLAEKRLLDAVDEVFARYRDRVMRDYRHLERDLNIMLETPKPQSRLHLSKDGLEIVIRYPAETYTAPQITDEISRRVLDAINREPSLRLAQQGIANIESQVPPPAAPEDGADQPAAGNGQSVVDEPVATAGEKAAGSTTTSNK
jgi:small-conductance mechanosensitive channel